MNFLYESEKAKKERLFKKSKHAQDTIRRQIVSLDRKMRETQIKIDKSLQNARLCIQQNKNDEERMHVESFVTQDAYRKYLLKQRNQFQNMELSHEKSMLLQQKQEFVKTATQITSERLKNINPITISQQSANMMENSEMMAIAQETIDDALDDSFEATDGEGNENREDIINQIREQLRDEHMVIMPHTPDNIQSKQSRLNENRKEIDRVFKGLQ